jgi:hypothetical protein
MSPLPIWLQWVQAIALILLPVVGAYVALKQMHLQEMRLQHDLYDRRFRIYDATRKFLSIALSKAKIDDGEFREFALATADTGFVFDNKIKAIIADIRGHGSRLLVFGPYVEQNIAANLAFLTPQQHAEYVQHKTSAMLGLNNGLEKLEAEFLPYMQLVPPSPLTRLLNFLRR